MITGTSRRDTIPGTPSPAVAQLGVSPVSTLKHLIVALRDTTSKTLSQDLILGVSIAEVPVVRARRNGGASKADRIARLIGDVVNVRRHPYREQAVIVVAPSDMEFHHKPNVIKKAASQAGASTTVLDPYFGGQPRGVMLMRQHGVMAGLPLNAKRGIMQAVLTQSDLILPPSTHGNFVIACETLTPYPQEY